MTIEWLAGNRLRGTTAERPSVSLQSPSVGGWVEVGRTTLDSTGNNIDVSSLPDKRYYMFLTHAPTDSSGYVLDRYRLNADTDPNYSFNSGLNGGAFGTGSVSQSEGIVLSDGASIHQSGEIFTMGYISNVSGKEKLLIGNTLHNDTAGSGTAPDIAKGVGKHAQTLNPVTSVNVVNTNNSGFASGSEVVVLGWDPTDTHTSNFWEELASVDLSGGASDSLSTGTFIPKKYMWLQWFHSSTGGTVYSKIRVGNSTIDTGSNYARRQSGDGGSDSTATGETYMFTGYTASTTPEFGNMFIINNASTEKLAIAHTNVQSTAGAGTAPSRKEMAFKWANTSNQINIIELLNDTGSGDMGTNTILKVWGSD